MSEAIEAFLTYVQIADELNALPEEISLEKKRGAKLAVLTELRGLRVQT